MRVKGRYANQKIELEQPLNLAAGTHVEVFIRTEEEEWTELGMARLEKEWDNPEDAIYDDWKKHYGA
jgi:hypothetical protein